MSLFINKIFSYLYLMGELRTLYPIGKSVWEYLYHSCGLIYCLFSLSNYSTFAISCPHHIFILLRLRFYFNSYLLKTIYLIKELVLKVKTFNYKKAYLYTILLTSYDTVCLLRDMFDNVNLKSTGLVIKIFSDLEEAKKALEDAFIEIIDIINKELNGN